MNLSVQTASSSSSTAHGTHETCSMSVIHNVSFAPWMCLSSLPNNGFLLKISRSSLSGRVLTLKHLQQVANSPKQHWLYWLWWCRWCWARSYGTSPQHPAQYVLSCSDVSRGPANHSVCGAPCCELANQSARTQVAFVWDDAIDDTNCRSGLDELVYSFTENYALKKISNKNAIL